MDIHLHHHKLEHNNNSREHHQRKKIKRRRTKMKIPLWLSEKLSVTFYNFSGHQLCNLLSFNDFTKLMFMEVDASSLGVARAFFGLMMLMDIPEERSGDLDLRWGMPKDCRFPLLPFLKPLSFPRMVLIYFVMWLGALGMTLGYKFKSSCFVFTATYWYIFMLDVSSWNNHSYLYGLVAVIFLFTDAHTTFSIDSLGNKTDSDSSKVPFWNYFLLKFQFFILYFIAGFKKFSTEWLIEWQYSMTNLSSHWIFAPFRLIMGNDTTDHVMIHWFAAIFDISVAFLLIYARTRPLALLLSTAFHTMNSRLFHIGMFPWVCLVELPLFCEREWPRRLCRKLKFDFSTKTTVKEPVEAFTASLKRTIANDKNVTTKRTLNERFTTFLILVYCCLQVFLPFSHFITKGYNGWVDGAYGYSFDMMIQNWHQSIISVKVVDNHSKQTHFIEPLAFTDSLRWTQYPSMAFQYSQCIQENLRSDFHENPRSSVLSSNNFSIYFDIWYSLNGRFHQRIYDPKVDFAKAQWHPFREPSFLLPLLTEYSYLRDEMKEIRRKVLHWNNRTNIVFFADFPQLTLENYILPEMDNVTIHVLLGTVKFLQQEENGTTVALTKGQSVAVTSGSFHKVTTISDFPSCFYYTFTNVNSSEDDSEHENSYETSSTSFDIIIEETKVRWENYKKFFYHVANSLLFEFYNVPMPRRIREVHDMY